MTDRRYKSQLRWHAGFYFFITTIAAMLYDRGASGVVSSPNWIYLVVGTLVASLVIGTLNYWLSARAEADANKSNNLSIAELAVGSDKTKALLDRGKRLGGLMTAIAVGAAAGAYVVYRVVL